VETVLEREKELSRVEGKNIALPFLQKDAVCSGYEIHMGRTNGTGPGQPLLQLHLKNRTECTDTSGFISADALIFGCYLHGLFDRPETFQGLLQWLALRKGLEWRMPETKGNQGGTAVFDRLADALESHVDLARIFPKN
jgi:adenosylcobyric acid synthase